MYIYIYIYIWFIYIYKFSRHFQIFKCSTRYFLPPSPILYFDHASKCNHTRKPPTRPNESIIYVHFLAARFQKIFLFIVQYKYREYCAEDQMLQDLILRTRLCGTGFIAHLDLLIHFHLTNMVGWQYFVPVRYQVPKGTSAGLALKYFFTWFLGSGSL